MRIHLTLNPSLLPTPDRLAEVVQALTLSLGLCNVPEKRWQRYGVLTGDTELALRDVKATAAFRMMWVNELLEPEIVAVSEDLEVRGLRMAS